MNCRQKKKLYKQKLSKLRASAKDGDVILLEFDTEKISPEEIHNYYIFLSKEIRCPLVCVPKDKIVLRNMNIETLNELRDETDNQIKHKIKVDMEMKLAEKEMLS